MDGAFHTVVIAEGKVCRDAEKLMLRGARHLWQQGIRLDCFESGSTRVTVRTEWLSGRVDPVCGIVFEAMAKCRGDTFCVRYIVSKEGFLCLSLEDAKRRLADLHNGTEVAVRHH